MSDTDRVLALLRTRKEAGVSPIDFAAPNVVDGEKPVMRVAARILELRKDGFDITTGRAVNGTAIYRLRTLETVPGQPETPNRGGTDSSSPAPPRASEPPRLWEEAA